MENELSNDVNKKSKFDLELSDFIDGKLSSNHIFNFGLPGEILKKCGFPENQKIEMVASRLQFKSNNDWHKFELEDIYGLDKALQNPVTVIEYGDRKKSQNIVVELQKDGKNFLAGIHFNQKTRGFEVSDIRTLFPKDTIEILNWIDQGKMIYGNKEKLQALINQQRINVAEVNNQVVQSPLHEHCLESVSNLIKKFGNVNQIFTDEYDFYKENKEKFNIFHKLDTFYTSMGTLDGHILAQTQADELYNALKNNDKETIARYTDENDFNDIAHLTKEIVDEFNEKRNSIMNEKNEPVYQEKLNESASLLLNIDFQKLSNTEEQNKLTEIFKNILKIENPNLDTKYITIPCNENTIQEFAEKLQNIQFNKENYKDLLNIINDIDVINSKVELDGFKINGEETHFLTPEEPKNSEIKSYVTDKSFTGNNTLLVDTFREELEEKGIHKKDETLFLISESQISYAGCSAKKNAPAVFINCPPDENHKDWYTETYYAIESVDDMEKLKKHYNRDNINDTNIEENKLLPSFAITTDEGLPKLCNDFFVKKFDKETGTVIVGNDNETMSLSAETYNSIVKPKTGYDQERKETSLNVDGPAIVIEDKDKGIEGTFIPEFALIDEKRTNGKMKVYKDLHVIDYNSENNSYKLSNGKDEIVLFKDEMMEAVKNERYKKQLSNEPGYKKLLETQYNDYFQQRDNSPVNFKHNMMVYCRKEANSPLDAIQIAKELIDKMSFTDRKKTEKLLKNQLKEGQTLNQLIVGFYYEATKEFPLNENYMRVEHPNKVIARPFYDTLYDKGQKLDNDNQLIITNPQDPTDKKDLNLKVGDTLKNINLQSGKIFGKDDMLHFEELTVVSASKESNSIILMDKNKAMFDLPRDKILESYKEQQLKEISNSNKHSRKNYSIEIER